MCEHKVFKTHTPPFLIHVNEEGNLDVKTLQNPVDTVIKNSRFPDDIVIFILE